MTDDYQIINSNKIKYLLVKMVKVTNNTSIFPVISCIQIDSNNIYINDGEKYYLSDIFKNFTIGIILDDNIFLKKDTGLLLYKNKDYILRSDNIFKKKKLENKIEFISQFCIIMIDNYEIIPFYVPANIIKIDYTKKYIDLSISKFYSLI